MSPIPPIRPLIKVCGMRDGENIRAVAELGVDWIGFIFWPKSPRNVTMIPSNAGILPDRAMDMGDFKAKRVGVFVDEMPQNIITRVVNYKLDLIQLHGKETPTLIRNLRRTLDPDIRPGIKIIKAFNIATAADFEATKPYEGLVDYFLFDTRATVPAASPTPTDTRAIVPAASPAGSVLPGGTGAQFDWSLLTDYVGETPFLLSGGIGPDDAPRLRQTLALDGFPVDKCIGIDLNSRFETTPAQKDVAALRRFLSQLAAPLTP